MKLTIFLILTSLLQVSASTFAQRKVTISMENTPFEKVLRAIGKQSGFNIVYVSDAVKSARPVTIDVKEAQLNEVLQKSFINQPLIYVIEGRTIIVKEKKTNFEVEEYKASIDVNGIVLDENGKEISGATVKVKGTTLAVVTDAAGRFIFKNLAEDATLIISYIGYASQELKVSKNMSVKLEVLAAKLEEVAVVAYGTQKKISVLGSLSSVSTEDLLQTPAANITNTLAGRLPGLISQQTSGNPGADAASLLIRGKGTYNGNTNPLVLVDGVERSFSTIDANEVENITILKDASSTAVFGIRGANGVILVTTRRGKKSKPNISFTANTSIQQMTRLPEFANSYEYATLKNEGYTNEGKAAFYTQEMLDGYKNHLDPYLYPDVDWQAEFLKKNSLMQQYNLNITGGSSFVKYFVSGSFLSQGGAYKQDYIKNPEFSGNLNYTRYNFRSNLDFDITSSTKLAINLGVRNDLRHSPYATGSDVSRIFSSLVRMPPNFMPVLNPDGSYSFPNGRVDRDAAGIAGNNVLADLADSGERKEYGNSIDASVILNQGLDNILKGLNFSTNFSMTNAYTQTSNRFKTSVAGGPPNNYFVRYPLLGKNPDGTYIYGGAGSSVNQPLINFSETNELDNKRWYFESKIDYKGNQGNHHYTGLLLFNASRQTVALWPRSYMGVSSRATYDYDNRYLLEVNLGYNGSENFAKGKRFGFFPAYAVGWVASNEKFLKDSRSIDLLKIRASYGEVGSDQGVDRFAFFNRPYSNTGNYAFGLTNSNTISGFNEGAFGNINVQWEVAKKTNIGIETMFLNRKIGFNADVFYELRDQILANYGTVPSILGVVATNLPSANIGRMENKGFELELNHSHHIGKLDYWIKANASFARNKILYRDEPTQPYPWLYRTGNSVDQQYGLVTNGFFNSQTEVDAWYADGYSTPYPDKTASGKLVPGDFKYIDQNGDKVIDNLDMVPIGKPTSPEYMFALSFGGKAKNFDFSAMFQGSTNTSMFVTMEAGWAFFNAGKALKDHLNRWTPENTAAATYPRLASSPAGGDYNYVNNDFWLKKASYVRLKQAQIGYTFNKSLIQNVGLRGTRIYIDGANLYTWSSIKYLDPENRNSRAWFYPQQRVFNIGVNITL
ncbi:MAG TPA: TonB-dependent receptor [Pedobacter sp.]|nr:TonB-dependent receptor [Pedobacter sp.]